MAKKITYLFGAGASANTIPIVADMHSRIIEINLYLGSVLKGSTVEGYAKVSVTQKPVLQSVITNFEWFIDVTKDYYSIDTLAKKYYLTDDGDSYEKLKKCLIIYFIIEQTLYIPRQEEVKYNFLKSSLDKRYDNFIAALAYRSDKGMKLNKNVKVLSWNYDLQFELSLQRFTGKRIDDVKKYYQIFPQLNDRSVSAITDLSSFAIRKINGNAIFINVIWDEDEKISAFDRVEGITSIDRVLEILLDEVNSLNFANNPACRFFNFSWEGNEDFDNGFRGRKHEGYVNNLEEAEKVARETEILVVIGYSFPIFNRQIDSRLFLKMEKLEKVYIQDLYPDKIKSTMINAFRVLQQTRQVSTLKSTSQVALEVTETNEFIDVPRIEILTDVNVNQFIIPYELTDEFTLSDL